MNASENVLHLGLAINLALTTDKPLSKLRPNSNFYIIVAVILV